MEYKASTPTASTTPLLSIRASQRFVELIKLPTNTQMALWKLTSRGISLSTFEILLTIGYQWSEINWIISKRKFQGRPTGSNLTLRESEQTLRLLKVHTLAVEVFGSSEKALTWMRLRKEMFTSLSALELVKLECGVSIIEEALYKIEEGYY